jgi:hypothetical protein
VVSGPRLVKAALTCWNTPPHPMRRSPSPSWRGVPSEQRHRLCRALAEIDPNPEAQADIVKIQLVFFILIEIIGR